MPQKNILLNAIIVYDFSLFIHQLLIEIVGKCVQSSVGKMFSLKRLMIWFIASASCWRFDKKLVCTEKSLMVESSGFRSGGLGDIATITISCNDFMRW